MLWWLTPVRRRSYFSQIAMLCKCVNSNHPNILYPRRIISVMLITTTIITKPESCNTIVSLYWCDCAVMMMMTYILLTCLWLVSKCTAGLSFSVTDKNKMLWKYTYVNQQKQNTRPNKIIYNSSAVMTSRIVVKPRTSWSIFRILNHTLTLY